LTDIAIINLTKLTKMMIFSLGSLPVKELYLLVVSNKLSPTCNKILDK